MQIQGTLILVCVLPFSPLITPHDYDFSLKIVLPWIYPDGNKPFVNEPISPNDQNNLSANFAPWGYYFIERLPFLWKTLQQIARKFMLNTVLRVVENTLLTKSGNDALNL